eukprot:g12327.t1
MMNEFLQWMFNEFIPFGDLASDVALIVSLRSKDDVESFFLPDKITSFVVMRWLLWVGTLVSAIPLISLIFGIFSGFVIGATLGPASQSAGDNNKGKKVLWANISQMGFLTRYILSDGKTISRFVLYLTKDVTWEWENAVTLVVRSSFFLPLCVVTYPFVCCGKFSRNPADDPWYGPLIMVQVIAGLMTEVSSIYFAISETDTLSIDANSDGAPEKTPEACVDSTPMLEALEQEKAYLKNEFDICDTKLTNLQSLMKALETTVTRHENVLNKFGGEEGIRTIILAAANAKNEAASAKKMAAAAQEEAGRLAADKVDAPMADARELFNLALGIAALIVSVLAYIQSLPSAELKREQQGAMHVLATQALLMFDALQTALLMHTENIPCDHNRMELMRKRARMLQEAIDTAIRLRLWNEIVGQRKHSLPLFTAFMESLITAGSEGATMKDWRKQHFGMGLLRIVVLCEEYHRPLKGEPLGPMLSSKVARWSSNGLLDKAWGYVEDLL